MSAKIKNITKKTQLLKKTRAVFSNYFHYIHKRFLWGIFKKIDEKFFKFLCVGLLNTIVSYIIYAFFITIGLKADIALFLQYILGVLWNFKTTGTIVFKNKNNKLIFKFIASYILTYFLNRFLLNILIYNVSLNEYVAQAILVLPIAIVSFLILKFFVFVK